MTVAAGLGWLALPFAASSALACTRAQEDGRPNVLLILTDQHNRRALGCMGNERIRTPNLDRLAAGGILFRRAYCTTPLCAPSRYSLLTGLYATEVGVLRNEYSPRADMNYLAESMQAAGYFTGSVGKLHFVPRDDAQGFDEVYHHEFFVSQSWSHYYPWFEREMEARGLLEGFKEWARKRNKSKDMDGLVQINPMPDDLTPEAWTSLVALKMMKRAREQGKPFFIHASYFPPHHPYAPVQEHLDRYGEEELPLPPSFEAGKAPPAFAFGPAEFERILRHYYAFTTQVDHHIGTLLAGLEELGLEDETLVVMTSDHGDMMGEFQRLGKGQVQEGSIGVPLIVRYPHRWSGGRVVELPVSQIDLMPTVLDLAGVEAPPGLRGESLIPFLDGRVDELDREVYVLDVREAPFTLLAVIEGDWKLGRTRHGQFRTTPSLVNLREDPHELENRFGDPEVAGVRERLEEKLDAFWERESRFVPEEVPIPPRVESVFLPLKE